ncbi:YceI family protein [Algihabitans albus]|uniref:YceI family protein n=1 Tax=Algihabitans albus TaxID=2164067 RepID=UPI000E5C8E89|nr:YceI family protein [Algihabitans albus]
MPFLTPLFPVVAVLVFLLALPAAAQEAPIWVANHDESRVGFIAIQSGSDVEGYFDEWSADIAFDPETATGRVEIVVQTASVDSGARDRDDSVKGDGLLHVEAFPEARFLAERFEATGEGSFEAHGDLTLRDTTRPVVLPFTLAVTGETAEAAGGLALDRLDYGVGQGLWADTSMIAAEVRIVFEILATRR